MRRGARAAALLASAAVALLAACSRDAAPTAVTSPSPPAALLGGDAGSLERALAPRPFVFPADHGPHPDFRTEWWYFTGNLDGDGGGRYGFQLTFFRFALVRSPPERASAWAARDVYMAHLALTDVAGRAFRASERFARGAVGLAGARAAPFRVWLHGWSAESTGPGLWPLRLRADDGRIALDLVLGAGKAFVAQGDAGLSRKSAAPGNASYYYSYTRLPARGTVTVGGRTRAVRGEAWMDREWSTSALARGQAGWDWFALQMDDARELMFYRMRRTDGGADPASAGVLVAPDGTARPLALEDVELRTLDWWEAADGRRYPARWRVRVAGEDLDLEVAPLLADQELRLSVRYWEGAVAVSGRAKGRPVAGRGYVELVGYGDPPAAD